ncbi:hypothetical protein BHECKSOX2_201 [Bathymodiolus heckerae thiotrophic gill symbiont]|nr:hypothetical protein BHECKSOX2_201 [Bathymodiolus heckerae thiotrophic gill symbiont]
MKSGFLMIIHIYAKVSVNEKDAITIFGEKQQHLVSLDEN